MMKKFFQNGLGQINLSKAMKNNIKSLISVNQNEV
jgi:hypothetical protein